MLVPQVAMLAQQVAMPEQRRAMPEQRRPLLAQRRAMLAQLVLVLQALLMRRRVSQQPDLAVLPVCTCGGGGWGVCCMHAIMERCWASSMPVLVVLNCK